MLFHCNKTVDRNVAPLGHIILIPNQPVFALIPYRCVFSREAASTSFIGSTTLNASTVTTTPPMNSRSTTLKASTVTTTPPIRF